MLYAAIAIGYQVYGIFEELEAKYLLHYVKKKCNIKIGFFLENDFSLIIVNKIIVVLSIEGTFLKLDLFSNQDFLLQAYKVTLIYTFFESSTKDCFNMDINEC
jgi:hypothetical protein